MKELILPTLVIGPEVGARGYGILRRSGALTLERAAAARLGEFPLLLARWSNRQERSGFAALLPLADGYDGPWLLARGAYLGDVSGDTMAFAHAMLIQAADMAELGWRADLLLDRLTEPKGARDFAAAPIRVDALPDAPSGEDWQRLGLAWRDRIVATRGDDDREKRLQQIISSIDPPEQRPRIHGWATTAGLPASDGFDPNAMLQLVVVADEAEAASYAGDRYLTAFARAGGFDGPEVDPPETWLAWLRFRELAVLPDIGEAVGAVQWPVDGQLYAPGQLLSLAAGSASGLLGAEGRIELIRQMVAIGNAPGERFGPAFVAAASDAFALLVQAASAEGAAYCFNQLATIDPDAAVQLGIGTHAARPGIGKWLSPALLDVLLRAGFGPAFLSGDAEAIVRDMPEASLLPLLVNVMGEASVERASGFEAIMARLAGLGAGEDSSKAEVIAHALEAEHRRIGGHGLARWEYVELMAPAGRNRLARWTAGAIDIEAAVGEGSAAVVEKVLAAALAAGEQLGGWGHAKM